jgi:hypothetical protein
MINSYNGLDNANVINNLQNQVVTWDKYNRTTNGKSGSTAKNKNSILHNARIYRFFNIHPPHP